VALIYAIRFTLFVFRSFFEGSMCKKTLRLLKDLTGWIGRICLPPRTQYLKLYIISNRYTLSCQCGTGFASKLSDPFGQEQNMKGFKRHSKNSTGFTLVELCVILAVISILTSLAVPAVINWLPDYRLRQAARNIYSNMQLAKITAIRGNADSAMVFNAATGQYFVCTNWGADNNWSTTADNTILKSMDLSQLSSGIGYGGGGATASAGVGVWPVVSPGLGYAATFVIFTPRGTCSESGCVYVQNDQNSSFAIGTLTSGPISLQKWYAPSASWD
jgi:type II secretory pathway pseudopilin PulG